MAPMTMRRSRLDDDDLYDDDGNGPYDKRYLANGSLVIVGAFACRSC
jgi:hypothetical protein